MKRLVLAGLICTGLLQIALGSGKGWSISVQPEGFEGEEILLAYYLGNAQYIKDTARLENGMYTFSGQDTLAQGIYLVVFPPDNAYFQLLIGEKETDVKVRVSMSDVTHPTQIKGSPESELFYAYVDYLQENRPKAERMKAGLDTIEIPEERERIKKELEHINAEVEAYQENIVKKHPASITALLIKTNQEPDIPEYTGTDEEIQMQRYHYLKSHYFDHVPMKDPRLVHTPVLQQKIDYYINKLTYQIPDSLILSVDDVLMQFDTSSEAFRIYLVHFLNTYAKSNIVGMDAVYVHLAEKYYAKGYAKWTEQDVLDKIIKNAETLKPLLLGKTAPDLVMYDRQNTPVRLHAIDAEYTVVFFWDPDCGHCKKSIPYLRDFYKAYHEKGIEIYAGCTSLKDEVDKCWEAVDEREMGDWINVVDPYLRSRFKQIYDVRNTPAIYILDRDKKIVMKKIGAEKLPEIIDRLLETKT